MNCRFIILAVLLTALLLSSGCAKTKSLPPKLPGVLQAKDRLPEMDALKADRPEGDSANILLRPDGCAPAEPNEREPVGPKSVETRPAKAGPNLVDPNEMTAIEGEEVTHVQLGSNEVNACCLEFHYELRFRG